MTEQYAPEALQAIQNDLTSVKDRLSVSELRQGAIESQLFGIDSRLLALRQSIDELSRLSLQRDRSREEV